MATIYELEKRLGNLENLVDYLSKQMTNQKEYSDADMAGARQGIDTNTTGVDRNAADIDYVAMMVDVDIPIEDE